MRSPDECLLGRALIDLDDEGAARAWRGRRVLVTGAAGSVGETFAAHVLRHEPARLILLDRAETRLFRLKRSLRRADVALALADVCDEVALRAVFAAHAPEVVVHAAAYKHVPMLEEAPRAAVMNNILGLERVSRCCLEVGARLIHISTDKAVSPVSVMGASKRVGELYLQALASVEPELEAVTLRFGNVLGSRGSVLEILDGQLARGEPLTITHPDMERYFLSPREAAGFILHAGAVAAVGAPIHVLDVGAACSIEVLASRLARQRGEDAPEVMFTGLRPGERLRERLVAEDEEVEATAHPAISRVRGRARGEAFLRAHEELLALATRGGDRGELMDALMALARGGGAHA